MRAAKTARQRHWGPSIVDNARSLWGRCVAFSKASVIWLNPGAIPRYLTLLGGIFSYGEAQTEFQERRLNFGKAN